uniref:NADH-ubiquinone oxidoreductase chain 3 n=1 Tax=Phascolosoma pacificum TaxID=1634976 RepID=A0A1D8BES0_9ANNE|nr:NADH dehydrogenase subunit 3 [Phascolosoma pacificum]AOS53042.1 NADH dehydrogenase subunit 3 [Phascolosoma pacificum]
MLLSLFCLILAFSLAILLLIITYFVSFRSTQDREKKSPFECGFDPKTSARLPFSLRFFLLTVIFLVFDIEIALLLPLPLTMTLMSPLLMVVSSMFLIILALGTLHEWNQGSLTWTYNK